MNQRYDQPFFVGHNNPRFPYARYGYLPPIEPPEEKEPLPIIPSEYRLFYRLQQLEGRFNHLTNKYNEHLDKSKLKAEAYKKKDTYIIK